jgi:hypothetical protein
VELYRLDIRLLLGPSYGSKVPLRFLPKRRLTSSENREVHR